MKTDQGNTRPVIEAHTWTDGGTEVRILRRIDRNGKSRGGFDRWGARDAINIAVDCDDWNPEPVCGGGLHGWPWGIGLGEGAEYDLIADRWLVLAVNPAEIVGRLEGGQKCKFRRGQKIYDGDFAGAWALVRDGRHRLIEAMAAQDASSSGDWSAASSSGDWSAASSSGDWSAASSSGDWSAASSSGKWSAASSSGDRSAASSSGYGSAASSSGDRSAASSSGYVSAASSSGYGSAASSSGDRSAASSSGYESAASSSGDWSAASSSGYGSAASSSGYGSAASSSGDRSRCAAVGNVASAAQQGAAGIAAAIGRDGVAQAGPDGCLILCYWSTDESRYRAVVGYVGENGILPDVRYRLNQDHQFEAIENQ